ncbi:type II toxin-antitoxin system RelE/ParE family toxin [Blastomonas sp.]|uniref:type II toxin-antitoxin system RelE/ParE family toxin n=1 Tax=Blastomonas sp. TaxID=1909299 RepID=UPI0039195173
MLDVRRTRYFKDWFDALRDIRAKAKIARRIERAQNGNLGDVAPVGDGVSEMRVHYGPGYRIYFVRRETEIVILLCGGDKGSQTRDIENAKKMAKELD